MSIKSLKVKKPAKKETGEDDPATMGVTLVAAAAASAVSFSSVSVSWEARVAEAAYFIAEKRGFESGHDLDDWFLAEDILKKAAKDLG